MRGVRIRRLNYRLMKTIRWGMIGCGDVAEIKSGPGLYKASHSKLVAVMRRNGLLAADFARRHGVPRWHDDADAIIYNWLGIESYKFVIRQLIDELGLSSHEQQQRRV